MRHFAHINWWKFSPAQILEKYSAYTFDRRYRTDTSSFVDIRDLDVAGGNKRHGERYQPSPVYSLRRLLERLSIRHEDYSFVDFGSGKGRTLLIAGELPFRQVLGVEFSEELHQQAERNIQCYRKRRATHVQSVHADASAFPLPADALVLYFFNPFTQPVLDRVLANIVASAGAYPRRIILIYLFLPDKTWLSTYPGFQLRKTWHHYHVFEYEP